MNAIDSDAVAVATKELQKAMLALEECSKRVREQKAEENRLSCVVSNLKSKLSKLVLPHCDQSLIREATIPVNVST